MQVVVIISPNSVNILWLLPQLFVITIGEVMFSDTVFAFFYSQGYCRSYIILLIAHKNNFLNNAGIYQH